MSVDNETYGIEIGARATYFLDLMGHTRATKTIFLSNGKEMVKDIGQVYSCSDFQGFADDVSEEFETVLAYNGVTDLIAPSK